MLPVAAEKLSDVGRVDALEVQVHLSVRFDRRQLTVSLGPGRPNRLSAMNGNEFAAERYMPHNPEPAEPTMSRRSRWPMTIALGACRRWHVRILAGVVVVWLIIGAIAAGQRGYYSRSSTNCAQAGTVAVTVLHLSDHRPYRGGAVWPVPCVRLA